MTRDKRERTRETEKEGEREQGQWWQRNSLKTKGPGKDGSTGTSLQIQLSAKSFQ